MQSILCFRYSCTEFREQHRHIVLEYMQRGHEFGRDEWRQAIIAQAQESEESDESSDP